jgi:putative Holliday junction resolvase
MRAGARLAIDPGQVRIGVAACDADASVVIPVGAIRRGKGDVQAIVDLARERDVVEVLVGWPLSLSGAPGPAARSTSTFATRLAQQLDGVPVRLVDERWTTAAAQRELTAAGLDARASRAAIDAQAAARLLDDALREERATGRPVGHLVGPDQEVADSDLPDRDMPGPDAVQNPRESLE